MRRIETTGVPPDGRARYWREEIGGFVGMPFNIAPRPARPLEMHSICMKIGSVVVGEVWGDAHQVSHASRASQDGDVCVIVIPRDSSGTIVYAGQRRHLTVDHAYLLDNRSPWTMIEDERFRRLFLGVQRADVSNLRRDGVRSPFIQRQAASVPLVELVKSLVEPRLAVEGLRNTTQKALASTLCDLLDSALDASDDPNAGGPHASTRETYHRQRVREYVLGHLPDPRLCVESVASAVGVSTRHLHRLYAREALPVGRWIWSERLDRCHGELTAGDGNKPIAAIARAWGFRDVAHFSRAFRSKFGMTPSAARRLPPGEGERRRRP